MTATEALMSYQKLTDAVIQAALAALKSGMPREDVVKVLQAVLETVENADDDE